MPWTKESGKLQAMESDTTQQLNNNKNKARFNKHSHQNRFSFPGLGGRTEGIEELTLETLTSFQAQRLKSVKRVTA